jgi:hypothetical protein
MMVKRDDTRVDVGLVPGAVFPIIAGGAPAKGRPRNAEAGIVLGVENGFVLYVHVMHRRASTGRHRADLDVTNPSENVSAGFPMHRSVIRCQRVSWIPISTVCGRALLGNVTKGLLATILAAVRREASTTAAEVRFACISPQHEESLRMAAWV